MTPEQAEGRGASEASDAYSLALPLYEGFTGDNPVRAGGPAATARRVGARLPRLGRRRRDLPAGLCGQIDACLDPRPDRRPELTELRDTLVEHEGLLSGRVGRVAPSGLERFASRHAGRPGRRPALLRAPTSPHPPAPVGPGPLRRLGAGLAAGALVLGLLWLVVPRAAVPVSPVAVAAAAALLIAVLPRAGWLVVALSGLAWLAATGRLSGGALATAPALLTPALLLPRAGALWSVPALAPVLGAAQLAPAFVGLAALASTVPRRVGLAAAGFVWLAAAELLSGRPLGAGVGAAAGPAGSAA